MTDGRGESRGPRRRRFRLWWLVPLALALQLPRAVSAHAPAGVQIMSPGVGVIHVRTGAALNVAVQYSSQPAVTGSTAVRVEMFHQTLKTVVAAHTVTVADGLNQQVTVPLSIPPDTPEAAVYRLRARVTNSDNPVAGDYTTSGGAFVVDAGPPDVEVMLPGPGDAPVQPLALTQIQLYGRIRDVSTSLAVRTEVAPAGSGAWSQTAQAGFFPAPGTAGFMGLIPATSLADGSYDVRVTVTDGAGYEAVRQTTFTVEKVPAVAPGPPRNVQAEPQTGAVRLHWSPPAGGGGVQSYQVKRNGAVVAQTMGATSVLVVTADQNVSYEVIAVNSVGASAPVSIQAAPLSAPPPPAALTVVPELGWNQVVWMPPDGIPPGVIVRYRIYRDGILLAERDPYTYYDNSAVPGVTYQYQVTAFAAAGESPPAPVITVATRSLPGPPGGPAPAVTTDPAGTVTLTWPTVANMADSNWDGYDIYRDGVWQEYLPYPATTWKDVTGVTGTTYTYAIDACNATSCTDPTSVTITAGAAPVAPAAASAASGTAAEAGAAPGAAAAAGAPAAAGQVAVTVPSGQVAINVSDSIEVVAEVIRQVRGSVLIDAGAPAVSQRTVDLALAVQNSPADAGSLRLSDDGTTWTDWEAFRKQRNYTLPSGQGRKTVYVQFRDHSGNYLASAQSSIMLDTTPPVGLVVLEIGSGSEAQVHAVASDSRSGVTGMRYTTDGTHWSDWSSYRPDWRVPLPAAEPVPVLQVQLRDLAGNVATTTALRVPGPRPATAQRPDAVPAPTRLDLTPPVGNIRINDGAATSAREEVLLLVAASDAGAGVTAMRFSHDGKDWTGWEAYRPVRRWVLFPGTGTRMVYVQFQDQAGTISAPAAASIRLEPEPDAGSQ